MVIAGFTATQRNQFLAMRGSKILRLASNAGYHSDVLSYLAQCIYGALALSVVSLLGFFVSSPSLTWSVWQIVWGGACAWTAMSLVRNEILMSRIFARLLEEEEPQRTPTPNSPLKKASLTGFHATAKHIAAKAVSPSSETMRTI